MTKSSETTLGNPARPGGRLKNMALFLASPFIGLYYAVLLPGKLIQLAKAEFQGTPASPKTADHK